MKYIIELPQPEVVVTCRYGSYRFFNNQIVSIVENRNITQLAELFPHMIKQIGIKPTEQISSTPVSEEPIPEVSLEEPTPPQTTLDILQSALEDIGQDESDLINPIIENIEEVVSSEPVVEVVTQKRTYNKSQLKPKINKKK